MSRKMLADMLNSRMEAFEKEMARLKPLIEKIEAGGALDDGDAFDVEFINNYIDDMTGADWDVWEDLLNIKWRSGDDLCLDDTGPPVYVSLEKAKAMHAKEPEELILYQEEMIGHWWLRNVDMYFDRLYEATDTLYNPTSAQAERFRAVCAEKGCREAKKRRRV